MTVGKQRTFSFSVELVIKMKNLKKNLVQYDLMNQMENHVKTSIKSKLIIDSK
jgi:hypothetical protein